MRGQYSGVLWGWGVPMGFGGSYRVWGAIQWGPMGLGGNTVGSYGDVGVLWGLGGSYGGGGSDSPPTLKVGL